MRADRSRTDRTGRAVAAVAAVLVTAVLALVVPATAEPPAPVHDPQAVRDLADEILARQEFQPPEPTLLERIGDWIADHLPGGGNGGANPPPQAGAGGSGIVAIVLLALAVVAIGWLVRVLVRQPRRRRSVEADPETEVEVPRSTAEWTALAAGHEADGRWKEGLRCRFRALAERLADEGVVPETAGRTAGELRYDVAANLPGAVSPFDVAVDLFERAWYGDLPTGPEEAARFAAVADDVVTQLAARSSRRQPAEVGA